MFLAPPKMGFTLLVKHLLPEGLLWNEFAPFRSKCFLYRVESYSGMNLLPEGANSSQSRSLLYKERICFQREQIHSKVDHFTEVACRAAVLRGSHKVVPLSRNYEISTKCTYPVPLKKACVKAE